MSWATHALQWLIQRVAKPQGGANPIKVNLSSDWGLKLDPMKLESLVIADQPCCGEYVLASCTHRPSRHESRGYPKVSCLTSVGVGAEGKLGDWDEVETR